MQIVVLAGEVQKAALSNSWQEKADVIWVAEAEEFLAHKQAVAFLDLEFVNDDKRKSLLAQLLPRTVIINSVVDTLAETNAEFVRINGWNTFLTSPTLEASCNSERQRRQAEEVLAAFGKKAEWLSDDAGFVAARVVSGIINEAYLALAEGVSTKEEINTAMKLGTAYPYGPFEWAEKIGLQKVVSLLQKRSEAQPRYKPAPLLAQEALLR